MTSIENMALSGCPTHLYLKQNALARQRSDRKLEKSIRRSLAIHRLTELHQAQESMGSAANGAAIVISPSYTLGIRLDTPVTFSRANPQEHSRKARIFLSEKSSVLQPLVDLLYLDRRITREYFRSREYFPAVRRAPRTTNESGGGDRQPSGRKKITAECLDCRHNRKSENCYNYQHIR